VALLPRPRVEGFPLDAGCGSPARSTWKTGRRVRAAFYDWTGARRHSTLALVRRDDDRLIPRNAPRLG
jgi:hypothetical protein